MIDRNNLYKLHSRKKKQIILGEIKLIAFESNYLYLLSNDSFRLLSHFFSSKLLEWKILINGLKD